MKRTRSSGKARSDEQGPHHTANLPGGTDDRYFHNFRLPTDGAARCAAALPLGARYAAAKLRRSGRGTRNYRGRGVGRTGGLGVGCAP